MVAAQNTGDDIAVLDLLSSLLLPVVISRLQSNFVTLQSQMKYLPKLPFAEHSHYTGNH